MPEAAATYGVKRLHPSSVARAPQPLIDIRPLSERDGPLGFIPGSRCFPEPVLVERPELLREEYPEAAEFVLVCYSGKRSWALAEQLDRSTPFVFAHLEGGMLAWQDAGLPLSGVTEVPEEELVTVLDASDFRRVVVSCFVAESVETQLNAGAERLQDPLRLVERVFDDCGPNADARQLLVRLDRLAELARVGGHPLEHIARNVDRMRASLRWFASRASGAA